VRTLGPLEVEDELGRVVELGSPKAQALFALLVIHANHVLSTDRIIDELWGDQPPSDGARNVRSTFRSFVRCWSPTGLNEHRGG
jgi:DNA-binding SARP family transcriptional activator